MSEDGLRPPLLVALVGLSGSGKSSVSEHVARQLGWRLIDLDAEVEAKAGATISELFERHGEAAFRRLESEALERALNCAESVIATGGGAPCQPGAMDALLEASFVVWLDAAPEVAARRLSAAKDRPLLAGDTPIDTLKAQAQRRDITYARAHLRIDVDDADLAAVAERVIAELEVWRA